MTKLPFNVENEESFLKVETIVPLQEGEYRYKRVTVADESGKLFNFDVNMDSMQEYLLSRSCSTVSEAITMCPHAFDDQRIIQNYANHIGVRMMHEVKGALAC